MTRTKHTKYRTAHVSTGSHVLGNLCAVDLSVAFVLCGGSSGGVLVLVIVFLDFCDGASAGPDLWYH